MRFHTKLFQSLLYAKPSPKDQILETALHNIMTIIENVVTKAKIIFEVSYLSNTYIVKATLHEVTVQCYEDEAPNLT